MKGMNRAVRPRSIGAGRGRHRVFAEMLITGDDVIVSVWGGTSPHVGSVVIAVPRPGIDNPRRQSATSSVYNFTGHKDEAAARSIAEKIAASCGRKAVVTAGIHLDNATADDIRTFLNNAEKLCTRLIKMLGGRT